MQNKVQLIAYVDRLTGADLPALTALLTTELKDLFAGVHLLPFFYPIDGSDAGFDPIDHQQVDPRLGGWADVKQLSEHCDIMADLIVNHASAQSPQFLDVLEKGELSPYWPLFLKQQDIFPAGITDEQANTIYRPRPTACFSRKTLKSGQQVPFWTTFTDNQIDINVEHPQGKHYLEQILQLFANSGIKIIRLDAAGYAIKRPNTRCFMLDDTFDFIDKLSHRANELGMETVAEIHSHYQTQIEVAKRVHRVYDFALPPLVLHALSTNDMGPLIHWLNIAPRNCLTVLDTHDGIGIVDAGPEGDKPGLLNAAQIDNIVETIHANSEGQSRLATGAAANNLDLYQVNCSYYEALGKNDFHYLIARAIQFFSPGVPQVYYAGLLAMDNDMALLQKTQVGRDINRPYLDPKTLTTQLQRPVVRGLMALIQLRNTQPAFDGDFQLAGSGQTLNLAWQHKNDQVELAIDLGQQRAQIFSQLNGQTERTDLSTLAKS
ncbi:sucrose phosphorylase [Vibrio sp. JPW-9-11-11]|uniref:sucrose phosphorylase n=1 Tax=Vibrio sp. JPW-9-11-11 TaxID=1416532 RepID=UPI001593F509|nr:sucrose phosphorylase [Vibrio sp. JPW-9-11-11]NVD08619.1 sucrose phosphorylase [Vibrio sp. JPW-9-11-11]